MAETKLNELDEAEWLEVARMFRPDLSDEQHMADYREFVQLKQHKQLN